MIAVITSTLQPTQDKSYFNFNDRLEQTKNGLLKLQEFNFQRIILFDNSDSLDYSQLNKLLGDFSFVEKYHIRQFQFMNKGLNEALLLLNKLHHLPVDTPLFKISGRYYPNENFKLVTPELLLKYDFIGVGVDFNKRVSAFTTRAFFVKNKQVLESTLILAIEEMLSYANGIHGIQSFFKSIKNFYKPSIGTEYQISLEQAFARVLKYKKNYYMLKNINVEGYVAGAAKLEFIKD
ncbi:MAG: hypothetical protein JWR67_1037 [Mucilaginibacter sp.]|nr:hypothetical protein [Mucilaginibacter sp.]